MLIRLVVVGLLVSVCLGKSIETYDSTDREESTIPLAVVENEISNAHYTEGMEVQDNGPDDMEEPKPEDLIAQEHVDEEEAEDDEDEEDEEDEDDHDESTQSDFNLPFRMPSFPSLPRFYMPTILPAYPPSWMPHPRGWLQTLLPGHHPEVHHPALVHPPPPHVAPHPHHGTYLKPMEAESPAAAAASRRRREAPLKTVEVKDASEWWYDLDGTNKDPVTEMLKRKAGFATFKHIEKQMDHYAPAIHLGKIDMGYKSNPELEHPSAAAVGKKADWNPEDYENAFAFQRHGEHVAWDMYELLRYFKAGKLPPGKKFIVSKNLVGPYSRCWFSHTNRKSFEELRVIDFSSVAARAEYWERDDCRLFQPGVYELIAIKETLVDKFDSSDSSTAVLSSRRKRSLFEGDFDHSKHDDFLKLKSVVIILKEVKTHYHGGRGYRAILNFNPQALQEYSPVKVKTSHSKLVQESADGELTKKFWFRQNAIPATLNHQDTKSGSKVGFNDYRKPIKDQADYENTLVWGKPVMTKPIAMF